MLRILGIDPGIGGALALYAGSVLDFPVLRFGHKRRLDGVLLAELIRNIDPDHVWIELASARPGQGVAGVFSFGYSTGLIHGVLGALKIPTTIVTPPEWKRALRVPADKNGARARATQLMPAQAAQWSRVKDHGRAEAALIAYYGWMRMQYAEQWDWQ